MRFPLIAAAAVIAACHTDGKEPVAVAAAVRASTLAVDIIDTIDGVPAAHVAVGGKLRVRVPGGDVTSTNAYGPFAIMPAGPDLFVIKATGTGAGEIEIETTTGYARFAVTAAPIASVGIELDATSEGHATVALLDAGGERLVDASLRVASGSAPVSFARDAWDRIELGALPHGDVLVQTDLLGATHAVVRAITADAVSTAGALAQR